MTRAQTSYAFKCFPRDIWDWLRARLLLCIQMRHTRQSLAPIPASSFSSRPNRLTPFLVWAGSPKESASTGSVTSILSCFKPAKVKLMMLQHLTATVTQFHNILYHGNVCCLKKKKKIWSLCLVLATLCIKLMVKSVFWNCDVTKGTDSSMRIRPRRPSQTQAADRGLNII